MDIKGVFDEAYQGFCYQNCIRAILKYYRSANYDFYINMSLSTKMEVCNDGNYKISYDKGTYGIVPSCKDKVLRQDDLRSTETVLEENLRYIEEGYPIINCVDGFYLDYFPYYKKRHCRHNLVLTGENLNNNSVTVLDWYNPHFYQGEVKKENYFLARCSENPYDGSIYSGYAIKNNWAVVWREGWNSPVSELIAEIMELSLRQYYHAKTDGNCQYGIEVYRILLQKLEEILNQKTTKRKEALKYMHQELYGSVKRKKFFLYFLSLVVQLSRSRKCLQKAYEHMNNLLKRWEGYLTILLKTSFRGDENEIHILRNKLQDIIVYEEGFYDYLLQLQQMAPW